MCVKAPRDVAAAEAAVVSSRPPLLRAPPPRRSFPVNREAMNHEPRRRR